MPSAFRSWGFGHLKADNRAASAAGGVGSGTGSGVVSLGVGAMLSTNGFAFRIGALSVAQGLTLKAVRRGEGFYETPGSHHRISENASDNEDRQHAGGLRCRFQGRSLDDARQGAVITIVARQTRPVAVQSFFGAARAARHASSPRLDLRLHQREFRGRLSSNYSIPPRR
jgi:hypothetical protein